MPEPRTAIEGLTGGLVPHLPKAYEKSVVLGGGVNLFPCEDPERYATILGEYAMQIARCAYQQGKRDARDEVKKAIFG
jgi:hypothetical protein